MNLHSWLAWGILAYLAVNTLITYANVGMRKKPRETTLMEAHITMVVCMTLFALIALGALK